MLQGIRILDLTAVVLGPLATQQLADLGADVIKIEPPEGDMMRANGASKHAGMSSIYLNLNRNKRSVVLDLKEAAGRDALRQLISGADVLVHNMRTNAIERLGFDYAAVKTMNPNIVYCFSGGFGSDGPHGDKPAFDDIIQSGSGLASLNATDVPRYVPSLLADKVTGMALAQAILAALLRRERTGQGAHVEVPMLETMTAFTLAEHMGNMAFVSKDGEKGKAGYARLTGGGRRVISTSDGYISLLPYTPKHWRNFFAALGRQELLEQFKVDSRSALNANIGMLYATLMALGPTKTTQEWLNLCETIDIPATPVYSIDDLPEHPQLKAVGLFEESEHPTEGWLRQVRPSLLVDGARPVIRCHAPNLGKDTEEVLREAGLTHDQIKVCLSAFPAPTTN